MLAVIEKSNDGYHAKFERPLNHSVNKVWAALTQNEKLEKWFSNLQVEDLQEGGTIRFKMNDGTDASFEMKITGFQDLSLLEYEWGEGRVRFELSPNKEGCLLAVKEFIPVLNDHTPKDLAGWHVCLDVLSSLLNCHLIEFPKKEWEKYYQQYVNAVHQTKKQ